MRLTYKSLISVGFGLALAIQALIGGLAYRNAMQQLDNATEIEAANTVMSSLNTTLTDLNNAETVQRTYINTADARFLRDFEATVVTLEKDLHATRDLTSRSMGQRARLATVEPIIRERLVNLRLALETFRTEGAKAALEIIREDNAVALMDKVRITIHGMAFEESARLEQRSRKAREEAGRTATFVAIAGGLALSLVALASLIVRRDLAIRVQAEADLRLTMGKLEAATLAKSEFLANMSHELRTPLNSVIGFAEMLDDEVSGPLNGEQRDFVQTIQRNGKHLLALINEILDLSKIEAGRLVLQSEAVDLRILIDDILLTMRPQASKKQIALTAVVETDGTWVQGDPIRLQQVITNLVTNAIKFSHEGKPVTVTLGQADGQVLLAVRDHGIGIAAGDQSRIFQAFVQVDSSHARKQEGTGLGLALSKRLIELHQGTLSVVSVPDTGSTFTVALPALPRAGVAPPPAPVAPVVLLVDDDPDSLALLRSALGSLPVTLVCAADGDTALALARAQVPALIVLDIYLPGRDGWDVLRTVRADPLLAAVPVIIASSEDDPAEGYRLGMNDYLVKPLDGTRLRQLVRQYVACPASVLVIEDNADFCHYLERALTPGGVQVRIAGNGDEGLQAIAEQRPDLILLDIGMPLMDGWSFLEAIKDMDPTLPVVVVTGMPLDEAEGGRLGPQVVTVWQKGLLEPQTLAGNVQALLEHASAPDRPE